MKRRLLLSCVSCLLALGLVTACNNEEDVDLNEDDGTTQNDGGGSGGDSGGSGGDTTDPGTKEAVTIENYALTFTFKVGDTEDTIPDGATIYISYGPQGQSWGDFIALDSSNSVTFATITTGTYDYKLVIYDGEDDVTWQNCAEITTTNQSFVVSEEDEGGQAITIKSSYTLEEILGGAIKPAEGTINVTIALENTEETEPYDGSTGTELTWYFDGFEWMGAGQDYKAQRTLSAYTGSDYNYDYYITVSSVDLSTDYTFNIAAYEWQNDFGTIGLAPADSLTLEWSEDNFYLWGEQYKAGTDTTDYTDYTWAGWGLGFSNLTSGSVLETATNLTIVMQLDFSKVSNTTNSDTNSLVTGVYFLVDGVSTAE